jgi:hypothetical protein
MPFENISLTSYPKLKTGMKLRNNTYFSFCILNCRNSKQDDLSDDLNFSNKHLYMNLPASGPILLAAQGARARKKGRLVDVVRGEIIIFLRMSSV